MKSFSNSEPKSRSTLSIEKREHIKENNVNIEASPVKYYKSLEDFIQKISKLKLTNNWEVKDKTDHVLIQKFDEKFVVSK